MMVYLLLASLASADAAPVPFHKQVLTSGYFCDGIHAGDFNQDGKLDIVAGPYWYEGPAFTTRHEFYAAVPLEPEKAPSNSMFSYVCDFNGDGWDDILVLGRVHLHQACWYENPRGQPGLWKKHFAFERVQGESPPFLDVDGDGKPELVALWENRWGLIQPNWKEPARPWKFQPITEKGDWHHFYHGTGVGDVDGDGRLDLILNDGWWQQPAKGSAAKEWKSHPFRFAPKGGAQMFACDVDGDGDADILTALDAHGWGLAWFEQQKENGQITFKQHTIMGDRALDGDGLQDLVVGKRRWAHGPAGDIEPSADPVLYWFRLVREGGKARYVPQLIDKESGVGVQITIADVNGDQRPDILTASKLGSFVFLQQHPSRK